MGYVATPTPDMGEWSVEVRSESFYLHPPKGERVVSYGEGRHPSMLELHLADIPTLRAALDQAERVHVYGAQYEWARASTEGTLRPVQVVCPAETIDASSVPAETWLALVSPSGPLADHYEARDLVLGALPSPEALKVGVAASLVEELSGRDGLVAEFVQVLSEELSAAARRYDEAVRAALGGAPTEG